MINRRSVLCAGVAALAPTPSVPASTQRPVCGQVKFKPPLAAAPLDLTLGSPGGWGEVICVLANGTLVWVR